MIYNLIVKDILKRINQYMLVNFLITLSASAIIKINSKLFKVYIY